MNSAERIYHHNEFGFTRKCTCHKAIHINFGTASLLLHHAQILNFVRELEDALETEAHMIDKDSRCIYFPTLDKGLMIVMSYNEILLLVDLLHQTLLMIEVEQSLSVN